MPFSFANIFKPKPIPDTTEILNAVQLKGHNKYAANDTNHMYMDIEELGGFPYLKTIIIGETAVKIKRTGCTITFVFKNDSITLNSDDTTISSNQIKKTKVYYTEIDFELDHAEAQKIKKEKVKEIHYTLKKKIIKFSTIGVK